MNIAIVGYGGMGQAVARVAKERGHEVGLVVDPSAKDGEFGSSAVFESLAAARDGDALSGVDVVVDFSGADSVVENVGVCAEAGVALVEGTTGWYEKMDEVRGIVEGSTGDDGSDSGGGIGFLWSSNFSIGVNLYFKMIENAAKLIDKFDEYDIWGHEIHHNKKADSPSGTAKTLEKILLDNVSRKSSVVEDKLDRRREEGEIHFSSLRGGAVNFEHVIGFDSAADTIKISHAARNRDGYALGAVKACEWLAGREGFYGMEDFMAEVLEGGDKK